MFVDERVFDKLIEDLAKIVRILKLLKKQKEYADSMEKLEKELLAKYEQCDDSRR